MANTKKETVLVPEEEKEFSPDSLTQKVEKKDDGFKGEYVPVLLPELPGAEDGVKIDKYEHVTIANEGKEEHCRIIRGEWTEVPWPVYVQLKQGRYPKI